MNFKNSDIVSIKELSREKIEHILKVAKDMVPIAKGLKSTKILDGKILATLFFEPSTRTKLSFETAMHRLGGNVISIADPAKTSVVKGESLADTIRMAESYADVIVLRHPQEGSARLAAEFSEKPVINAGDGAGQHPTQTLLDLFTIKETKGRIENINIVLVGDLKYGRTVHSLAYALALFNAKLTFVAPPLLNMPLEIVEIVEKMGVKPEFATSLEEVIENADILYVTRIQRERFPDPAEYKKVIDTYRVDCELLNKGKRELKVMHPLPRTTELSPEVDSTEHALYFAQAFNGVPVRMAILSLVLGAVE